MHVLMVYNDSRFRCINFNIFIGDVILREQPYAAVLEAIFRANHCAHCMKKTPTPIPCYECSTVRPWNKLFIIYKNIFDRKRFGLLFHIINMNKEGCQLFILEESDIMIYHSFHSNSYYFVFNAGLFMFIFLISSCSLKILKLSIQI